MAITVVGAVVGATLGAVTNNVLALGFKHTEKRCELLKGLENDIECIKQDLRMIAGSEEDKLLQKGDPSLVMTISMEEMRDLAYDIEDCLDRILRYAEDTEASTGQRLRSVVGGPPYATEIERLMKRLKASHQRRVDYNVNAAAGPAAPTSTSPANTYTTKVEPVGIDKPKQELLKLLTKDIDGQSEQLNVISIVGFVGSGKSTLAKAVYDSPDVVGQFPDRAWVVASEHRSDTKRLLTALHEKLRLEVRPNEDDQQLQDEISNYLKTNRCLIVLDDIEEQQWDCIKSSFPEKTRSRVLVTTTIQAVAKVCCRHGNGYVYNMRNLEETHSKELLRAVLNRHLPDLEQISTSIVDKCDGHPLSLVSVANYLLRKDVFTETDCKNFWSTLGDHMKEEFAFRELEQVLMNNYSSLAGRPLNLRACLLYVCVFPNGHPIRRNSLMRRWLAEGYVKDSVSCKGLLAADKNLEKLIDRNIIRAIDPSKNGKVKTCRAHGIMHEFMLHMSRSSNFITSIHDPQRKNYRHLFMEGHPTTSSGRVSNVNHGHTSPAHGGTSRGGTSHGPSPSLVHSNLSWVSKIKHLYNKIKFRSKLQAKAQVVMGAQEKLPQGSDEKLPQGSDEKLRAHSLTICGSAGEAVVDFARCELLRVLDLEECKDWKDDNLSDIHKLWHLKYLSLGATISRLPRNIEKLHCLETLDMRKAKIETLPVEVIKLPHLAHLLGKFKLKKADWRTSELFKFLPKESNLETLAGFVTDGNPGFPMLMVRMKKLRKVKIWCNSTGNDLLEAIKQFLQVGMDTNDSDRSLSLDLGNSSRDILSSLGRSLENSDGYLGSLKLHGALGGLTQFTAFLCGLRELCLSSTNGLTINELSNLRKLKHLQYLKMVKVSLRGFTIRRRDFPRLLRLCLVQSPTLPTIEEKALPNLVSLQLLNEDLGDLSGIEIRRHEHLQEVALDSEIKQEAKTVWEDAAKNHPKRPRVLYLKRVDPDETGSVVKYVVSKRPAPEAGSSVVQEERQIHAVQSISVEELSSALMHVNVAGPSMASTELPSAMNNVTPSSSRVVS